jgi:Ca2+-binding EF-hand superfamily protein
LKKFSLLVLLFLAWATLVTPGLADEKKDHVCFRVLDIDKDGRVTFAEFEKVYGEDKQKFTEADADSDGSLTHEEYHVLLGHGSS